MSVFEWLKKSNTITDKSARKQFGLTQKELIEAMKNGSIRYRKNFSHKKPVFLFLLSEIESLANEIRRLHPPKKINEGRRIGDTQLKQAPQRTPKRIKEPSDKSISNLYGYIEKYSIRKNMKNKIEEDLVNIDTKIKMLNSVFHALESIKDDPMEIE